MPKNCPALTNLPIRKAMTLPTRMIANLCVATYFLVLVVVFVVSAVPVQNTAGKLHLYKHGCFNF